MAMESMMKKPKDTEHQLVAPSELAKQINEHHAACETAMQSALQHAIAAGELLAKAKALVPHGTWADWLTQNFASTQRTASLYVRLYEHRAQISNGVANSLSIRDAEKLTRTGKRIASKPTSSAATNAISTVRVTNLMQLLRSELQRCSETELTEATIKARKVLDEMGSPKQQTYEEWKAEFDRQNEPARQAAEQAKEKRDAENAATQAKKRAAIEAKHSAIKRRSDENWAAFDAQRGEADE